MFGGIKMTTIKTTYTCPIELTMDIIGGKWKLRILFFLNENTKRFSEIGRLIPNITQKMLTQQLREMESDGLITRKIYAEVPPKVEYSSTDLGKSVQEILDAVSKWGHFYALDNDIKI
jgi:DNA-binding HxlR family transcriptional regulator